MGMRSRALAVATAFGVAGFGGTALADGAGDGTDAEALQRKVEEQDRRIRELEGASMTRDEVVQAVDRYLGSSGSAPVSLVGGGADEGKAGFPKGKKPFIKEGPNKIEFAFRNQVRWQGFAYSDDAVGTLKSPADTLSDAAPRDRSGFEIERLYFGLDGSVFCEDITFKLELNFDADSGTGIEKRYAYMDWKYSGDHHVRAGSDKVPYSWEEQTSSSALAFVDRSIVSKAFELGFDNGVSLWGTFGGCECPKQFMYKVNVSDGEGAIHRGSVFNTDAFDTYSDQFLYAGQLEWNITCKDWKWDEVDHRPCDERCHLDASLGAAAYYENDDDTKRDQWGGLKVRGSGPAERTGLNFWARARYDGWTAIAEYYHRAIKYTGTSTSPDQTDSGAHVMLNHRFAESNWGVGVRAGLIWIDDDYDSITVGGTPVAFEDTITEFGACVNYYFWDHSNKLTADVVFVQDNSGVSSSSGGFLVDPAKGVVIEDGVMFRVQWQLNL